MVRKYRYYSRSFYEKTEPLTPSDGIKARTRRGSFGGSWWGQKFISVLSTYGWDNRLTRGKTYARKGQVTQVDITSGQIKGKVQGTRPTPYKVVISFQRFAEEDWNIVVDHLVGQALYTAEMLAGSLPHEVVQDLEDEHYPLIPTSSREIDMSCSCPDSAVPCKHISAVYYIVSERIDSDPFLLFVLRGITKESLMQKLRDARSKSEIKTPEIPKQHSNKTLKSSEVSLSPQELESFWGENMPDAGDETDEFIFSEESLYSSIIRTLELNQSDPILSDVLGMLGEQLRPLYELMLSETEEQSTQPEEIES